MYHTLEKRARLAWKAEVGPNASEHQALAEIDRCGGLLIAFRDGRRVATAADGTPISRLAGSLDLNTAIELGGLRPDPQSPALLPDMPPQRYLPCTRFVERCQQ